MYTHRPDVAQPPRGALRRESGVDGQRPLDYLSPAELVIEVSDNGCGIPPENIPHLAEPFFSTNLASEGTGLGLAIAHSIITRHGGRIEVESRVGEGTTFRVVLPWSE